MAGEIAQLLNRSTKADSIKLNQLLEEYMLESSDQDLSDDDSECMSHVSDDEEDGFDMTDVTRPTEMIGEFMALTSPEIMLTEEQELLKAKSFM